MKTQGIIIIIIAWTLNAAAGDFPMDQLANSANRAYAEGNYLQAIEQYEQILQEGYESSVLYYNLGNAFFKMNNMPSALLYYEKAMKLDPTDESTRFNLELANSRIIDKIEPLPQFFLKTWTASLRNQFSPDQWANGAIAGFILFLAALFIFIVSGNVTHRKVAFSLGITFLVVVTAAVIFGYSGYKEYRNKDTAIVFTPTVTVKSSPNEQSVDLFVIHEGTKVWILDALGDWSEIRLANGNVGWVKKDIYRLI